MKSLRQLIIATFALVAIIFFSSCEEENTLFYYDIVINFTVDPQAQPSQDRTLSTTVVTTGIEAQLNNVGASIDDVESIQMDTAYVVINTPAGTTFDIVEWVNFIISTANLPDQQIAYKSAVPQTGLTVLGLGNQYAELAEYIKSDEFDLRVRGAHDDPIPQAVNFTATTTWKVSVKP